MKAAAQVIELSKKRDALKADHEPNETLRDQIVALKTKAKRAKSEDERKALLAQADDLAKGRARSTELDAVMKELGAARAAAAQEAIDEFVATLEGKSDEELETLHLELTAQRSALKWRVTALSQLRSSRAKIAANRSILKHLTPAEIFASLTPAQRAALSQK